MPEVLIKCAPCKGSGVVPVGRKVPRLGMVCTCCSGTGRDTLRYEPFVARTVRVDIDQVVVHRGPTTVKVPYTKFREN